MDEHSVLSALTAEALDAAAAVGLDADALMAEAGLDPAVLADPDARVPLEQDLRLWACISRHPRGLEIGARMGLSGMGVLGYAVQHGDTVGTALSWVWRFRALVHPDVIPQMQQCSGPGGDEVVFARVVPLPFARLREPVYAQASAIVALMQTLSGTTVRPLRLSLPLPEPGDAARIGSFLGCPVQWSHTQFEIAFPAAVLARPLPRADKRLFGYLARRAEQLHADLPDRTSVSAQTRRAIEQHMVRGEPRLGVVARALGLSERTLNRRLEDEGTRFKTLLEQARKDRALLLLQDPHLTGSQLAFLLGYADPAAFFRAFKRWTGQTCAKWRRDFRTGRAPAAGTRDPPA